MFFLIIGMIFAIPYNMGIVNAQEEATAFSLFSDSSRQVQEVRDAVCGKLDIKESLVLSIVTMCLPGILEKTYEWKQIQCQAVHCYYNMISADMDPSFCINQKSYRVCSQIVGEVFINSPLRILDYWRQGIANILANPVGILWSGGVVASRAVISKCTPNCNPTTNPALNVAIPIVTVTDALSVVQTFKDMSDNGFGLKSSSQDYCKGIDKIKKEMEDILEATRSYSGSN